MCELCSFRCSDQSGLNFHTRNVHDKIKPHKCNICQKSFGYTAELNQHITAVHEGIKAFKCSLCDKKFSFTFGLWFPPIFLHEVLQCSTLNVLAQGGRES